MPEGDTIFKAARTLRRALVGRCVTRFETVLVQLARVDHEQPIAGRTVEQVAAVGKHLLITFSPDLVLRTHMRMNGTWHVYRPTERWQAARRDMRILVETAEWVAVAFRVHDAELVARARLTRETPIGSLGPDLLATDFDAEEAVRRMRARKNEPMAEVLLDQRVVAGLGNVYKSEVLFMARVHPATPTGSLDDGELREVLTIARTVLLDNVVERPGPAMVTYRSRRRTTGRLHAEDRLWVYGRGERPCRRCGHAIVREKRGDSARVTYWCPRCQPMR